MKIIAGVMGAGDQATTHDRDCAFELGQIIFACGMGSGTASEVALALKANKPVILLNTSAAAQAFFQELGSDRIFIAATPKEAITQAKQLLQNLPP